MAVRRDAVQLDISFITDESKALAKTLQTTKEYNNALAESAAKIKVYQKELEKVGADEAKRAPILVKISAEEQKIAINLGKIAIEGKKVEGLDLNKVAPAQLIERAKQLEQAMKLIPQSAPAFRELQGELAAVNTRLAAIRAESRGVAQGVTEAAQKTTLLQRALSFAGGFALFDLAKNALGSLINFGRTALSTVDEQLKADAQVKAAIRSTGGEAGRSLEQLKAQAEDLQKVTLFGDEQTEGAQALLLTFRNIKGEVFDDTIPLLQDLSTALKQDLSQSAIQVGKALNDPIQGVTALQRVGITFSEEQKKMIKALVDTGDVAGAQRVILKELETQVGGSARAAAEAGLGPYQVLQTRLSEVQESVGLLIERGLKLLAPAFRVGVEFLEQFTQSLLSGESATGKFRHQINFGVAVLNGLVKVGQFVFEVYKLLYDVVFTPIANLFVDVLVPGLEALGRGFFRLIEFASELPVIGTIFQRIGTAVQVFRDLVASVPATFEGFRAAAAQAVTNVVEYFVGLVRSAKIVAKELELALTVRPDARGAIQAEIDALKRQEVAAKNSGRTIGQAYAEARNKAIQEANAQAAIEEKAEAERKVLETKTTVDNLVTNETKTVEDRRKKALEERLTTIEASFLKEELVTDRALFTKEISEAEHGKRILELKQRQYTDQITAFRIFHAEETKEAFEAQRKLLEVQQQLTAQQPLPGVAPLPGRAPGQVTSQTATINKAADVTSTDEQIRIIQEKTRVIIETEQQGELLRIDLMRTQLEERLRLLREAGLQETTAFKQTLDEKIKADEQYNAKKIENEKRTADLKKKIEEESLSATSDLFGSIADLLAIDEKNRKKNAATIKAFQTAQVITDGIKEVSAIWSHSADLGPIAGPIVGGILTAAAVARTVLAINKINSTKFERGVLIREWNTQNRYEQGGMPPVGASMPKAERGSIWKFWTRGNRYEHGGVVDAGSETPKSERGSIWRFWTRGNRYERGGVVDAGSEPPKATGGTISNRWKQETTLDAGAMPDVTPLPAPVVRSSSTQAAMNVFVKRLYQETGAASAPGIPKGKFGYFGGKPHSAGGTKGVFEDGTAIEVERDEAFAVVNKKNAPMLRFLSQVNAHGGNGVPFFQKGGTLRFAGGGIPPVNTNPIPTTTQVPEAAQAAQAGMDLAEEVRGLRADMANWNRTLKAHVVYQEVETAGAELNTIRDDASI